METVLELRRSVLCVSVSIQKYDDANFPVSIVGSSLHLPFCKAVQSKERLMPEACSTRSKTARSSRSGL